VPLDYLAAAREFCDEHGLRLHLDGARVANAAVACGVSLADIGRHFDSISVCLSKGLCAPVGSVLCGSRELIDEARRWRKVVGGGMRQVGVIAAAAELALCEQVERLAEDHANAALLAELLAGVDELQVRDDWTQSNMVWIDLDDAQRAPLAEHCRARGVIIPAGRGQLRLVTHKDVDEAGVRRAAAAVRAFFAAG